MSFALNEKRENTYNECFKLVLIYTGTTLKIGSRRVVVIVVIAVIAVGIIMMIGGQSGTLGIVILGKIKPLLSLWAIRGSLIYAL